MHIVGLLIALLTMGMAMFMGGNIGLFIDVPSVMVLVGVTLGALWLARVSIAGMFRAVFTTDVSKEDLAAAVAGLRQARTYLMASAWIGFMVGAVIVGHRLDHVKALGPAIGLITLPVLYATILSYVILLPLRCRLEDRLREAEA